MQHFTNDQHGLAEELRALFTLLSQCIAELVVAGEHDPMPEYRLELSAGFEVMIINIPETPERPNDAVTLMWAVTGSIIQLDIHRLEKTYRLVLEVDDAKDARGPRNYNEEVLTTLEVVRQVLIKKTRTRLIPVNRLL